MLRRLGHGCSRAFHSATTRPSSIVIALGSNLGNRARHINNAVDELRKIANVRQTSFLYESKPMYVTDQPAFLNAACEVESDLEPLALLRELKRIESALGRCAGARNGPRAIDLDIVVHGQRVVHSASPDLSIPHPRLAEREFVLRPLCDLCDRTSVPAADGPTRTAGALLAALVAREGDAGLVRVTPTPDGRLLRWGERTLLMGILNVTPDSFSDGGEFVTVDAALRQAEQFTRHGFDIIDIGGQSTRPGASPVSTAEELSRVLPITAAVHAEFPELHISADTFNASVAEAMVAHGAGLVNDVSGGALDGRMASVMAEARAAAVLMHMRGTPGTMQTLTAYAGGVAETVGAELRGGIGRAERAGVARWAVIADPGIGFAKTGAQSARLVRRCGEFRRAAGGFPVLLGASRKSWLRAAGAGDADWATAGAVGAAVGRGGVDAVRVHAAGVGDAVRAADAVARA